jgi:ABC-type Co2+ transport system permease subunit
VLPIASGRISLEYAFLSNKEHLMHIEVGILSAPVVAGANAAALATLTTYARDLVRRPLDLAKTLLAAVFFSLFMEVWHPPVGPSELHFIGASLVYFVFGFTPTMFGFALGLLLQCLLFEPQDMLHIGVNALSLIVPLIAAHTLAGRRVLGAGGAAPIAWASVLKFDAIYYGGVVTMVGFWLAGGNAQAPFADWALFAACYLPVVLCEPAITCAVLRAVGRLDAKSPVRRLTALDGTIVA